MKKKRWIVLNEKKNRIEFRTSGDRSKFACCDCGLTHNIVMALEENGKIGMAFERNEKVTR